MKSFFFYALFIVQVLFGCLHPVLGQNATEKYLCFDYALQYEFQQAETHGKILIRYNSLDKTAMYQFFTDGEWQEDILRFHFSGKGDLDYFPNNDSMQWIPTDRDQPIAKLSTFTSTESLGRYLRKSALPAEIAGFESYGWEGTGPDGTYRKIYLMEDAFDARPISHLHTSDNQNLPITLAEANYLNDSQILMKSLIYQENELLHALELTWITHDFFAYPIEIDSKNLPEELPIGANSQLFQKYQKVWLDYERLSGLTYDPRRYSFTDCYIFEWHENQSKKGSVEACFNSEHTVCALYFTEHTYPTLVFLNGQIHQYKENEKKELAAWVHLPPAEKPSMEDLEFIRLSATHFQNRFKHCAPKLPIYREDNWFCKESAEEGDPWERESIALRKVDFDTRALHTGIHQVLVDIPELLDMPIPPYQLLTYWKGVHHAHPSLEWKLVRKAQQRREFDDTQVTKFYKFY